MTFLLVYWPIILLSFFWKLASLPFRKLLLDPFIYLYTLKLRYSLSSFIYTHLSSLLSLLILHISLWLVPPMFIVLHITFIVTNPKSIPVALNFRFLSMATCEYFYLDILKSPHIWHVRNLIQLYTHCQPRPVLSLISPYLGEWYYYTYLIVQVRVLVVIYNPSLSLAQITCQSSGSFSPKLLDCHYFFPFPLSTS